MAKDTRLDITRRINGSYAVVEREVDETEPDDSPGAIAVRAADRRY